LLAALVAIGLQGLAAPARAQTAPPPDFVMCPQVPGYDATFEYQTQVSFDAGTGGYRVNCWYQSTDVDENGATAQSELILDASWAPPDDDENVTQWLPDGVTGVMITYCSDVDEFNAGVGITASGDRSVRSTYKFREPAKPHDPAVGADAANALRAVVEQYARSCDGVEIIPRSAYFTPLPAYLVEALEVSAGSAPADPTPATAAPTAPPETTTPTDPPPPADAAAPPPSPDTPTEEGSKGLQAIGFVLLGLSVLGLLWTLKKAGKERRVRPRFDVLRVLIIAGTAIGTMIVLANTPIWAVAGGAGLGVVLGWAQGRNVAVRVDGKRAYEKRQVIAIVAFAVGLVISQGAGLLNRTGVIGIGVGVTFLSAATAAGLIAGRRKPLRAARATGVASVLIGGLLLVSFLPLVAVAVAQEQPSDEERRNVVLDDLTAAVSWDQVEVTGGLFAFEGKPLAVLPISPGLTEPPAPLTRTVEWVWVPPGSDPAFGTTFSVTETFSFSLNADGICCTVSYEGEGIDTRGGGESVVTASGTIGDYVGFADQAHTSFDEPRGSTWGIPFGAPEQIQVGDSEAVCRRPVASAQRGGPTDWEATWNGKPAPGTGQSFGMYTGCDIAGFDVPTAQAALPPVPAASASERDVPGIAAEGGGCPVFQESFNALYDESMGSAATDQLRRLMVNPNSSACSSFVSIGDEGPGGVRSEIDYDLATPDPDLEARRQYDAAEDLLRTIAPHELDKLCDFDDRGIALAPPPGETCELHTFHPLSGGTIRIFTDYASDDGPNVIVSGSFDSVKYRYRCHHCNANSPEVARIVVAMEVFGNTGLGNFGPNAQVIGSVGAPEGAEGETFGVDAEADQLADLLTDDPYEAAVLAGLIGLAGVIGMVGAAAAEVALERREDEGDVDEVSVWDEKTKTATWMTPDEAEVWYEERKQEEIDASIDKHKDNFAELLERARKEELDWLAEKAAKEHGDDEFSVLLQDSDDIRDIAAEGGYDDILDFLERNPRLTPEQVQDLYDALNRRAGDEAVLEKMGEVDVFWETVTGTQEDIAEILEATGHPVAAWMVRNPGITLRVGAAVGSFGWSEVVAVPLDITIRLREAQEKSLEENGRLMTSEELFGELGWAVGVEIMYEVGGHTVAAGIGKAADLVRGLDDAAETAVRQADELGEAGMRQADELLPVPPKGNEALAALPPGTRISDDLLAQTGYTQQHLDKLAKYASDNGYEVGARAANPYGAKHLADGSAIPKPLGVKAKTVSDIDVMLGANPAHRGTVGIFPPKLPPYEELQKMSPDLRKALEARYQSRLKEFYSAPKDLKKFQAELIESGDKITKVRLYNGQVQARGADGRWRNYAPDMDVVYIRDAAGNPLPSQKLDRVIDEMKELGLVQHGGEVRVIEDVMRKAEKSGMKPGSAEWSAELRDAIRLRESLEAAHADEVVVAMTSNGTLVRGDVVDEVLSGRILPGA
jgi:hypothetical protein